MKEFYSDLSGSSGSEASDHLNKLKSLFKSSNLAKQCSKPGKRPSLPYKKHRNISLQVPSTITRHQTSKNIGKQEQPKVLYRSQIPDKLRIPQSEKQSQNTGRGGESGGNSLRSENPLASQSNAPTVGDGLIGMGGASASSYSLFARGTGSSPRQNAS